MKAANDMKKGCRCCCAPKMCCMAWFIFFAVVFYFVLQFVDAHVAFMHHLKAMHPHMDVVLALFLSALLGCRYERKAMKKCDME